MGQTPSKLTGYFRYKDGQRYDLTDSPDRTYNTTANNNEMTRHVLVTGGATVPFEELLSEVTTPAFFSALRAHGFTHVHLQCHDFLAEVQKKLDEMDEKDRHGLEVNIFDIDYELKQTMQRVCRPEDGVRLAGFVIGHAGTGTIADAMESEVAIVIVANQNLMHNHQARFATHIAGEYPNIIEGKLGLAETIPKALEMIDQNGLDHLEPLQEEVLPLGEGSLSFIDQVIASGL